MVRTCARSRRRLRSDTRRVHGDPVPPCTHTHTHPVAGLCQRPDSVTALPDLTTSGTTEQHVDDHDLRRRVFFDQLLRAVEDPDEIHASQQEREPSAGDRLGVDQDHCRSRHCPWWFGVDDRGDLETGMTVLLRPGLPNPARVRDHSGFAVIWYIPRIAGPCGGVGE